MSRTDAALNLHQSNGLGGQSGSERENVENKGISAIPPFPETNDSASIMPGETGAPGSKTK
jgi:hypothetical protein